MVPWHHWHHLQIGHWMMFTFVQAKHLRPKGNCHFDSHLETVELKKKMFWKSSLTLQNGSNILFEIKNQNENKMIQISNGKRKIFDPFCKAKSMKKRIFKTPRFQVASSPNVIQPSSCLWALPVQNQTTFEFNNWKY